MVFLWLLAPSRWMCWPLFIAAPPVNTRCVEGPIYSKPPHVCAHKTHCAQDYSLRNTQNTDANTNTKQKPGLIILKAPQCVNTKHVVLRNSHIWKRHFGIISMRYIRVVHIYYIYRECFRWYYRASQYTSPYTYPVPILIPFRIVAHSLACWV